jgi:hypothetical protein
MKIVTIICSFIMLFAATSGVHAQEYEVSQDRNIADIVPAEIISGPHYQIQDRVISYGYMDHFTVFSDYGAFEVTGDYALRKLLKEIQAIAALRELKKSKEYLAAVKKAGKQPLEFGKNLITDPVDTVTGIPKGAYRLFHLAGTSITKPKDPSEDSRVKTLLLVTGNKRDCAAKLGVDVYSSNPVLQKELNSVGWAGALGSWSVTAALAPAGGVAVMVVKGSRMGQAFNDLLQKEPAPRLREINQKKLESMGVSKDLTKAYLDHASFTPRHDTILVGSLAEIKGVWGQSTFISLALTADDEETANFFQNMAEIMLGYHETVSPLKEITTSFGLVFAKAENGSVLVPFPLDHGVWRQRGEWVITNALAVYKQAAGSGQKGPINFWVTGTVSPLAKTQMAKHGITVTENVDTLIGFMD